MSNELVQDSEIEKNDETEIRNLTSTNNQQ